MGHVNPVLHKPVGMGRYQAQLELALVLLVGPQVHQIESLPGGRPPASAPYALPPGQPRLRRASVRGPAGSSRRSGGVGKPPAGSGAATAGGEDVGAAAGRAVGAGAGSGAAVAAGVSAGTVATGGAVVRGDGFAGEPPSHAAKAASHRKAPRSSIGTAIEYYSTPGFIINVAGGRDNPLRLWHDSSSTLRAGRPDVMELALCLTT